MDTRIETPGETNGGRKVHGIVVGSVVGTKEAGALPRHPDKVM